MYAVGYGNDGAPSPAATLRNPTGAPSADTEQEIQSHEFDRTVDCKAVIGGCWEFADVLWRRARAQLQPALGFCHSLASGFTPPVDVPVTLNVYDFGKGTGVLTANRVFYFVGGGVYHTGIEIYGTEWSFDFADEGTGIFTCEPTRCEKHTFRRSVPLGVARLRKIDFDNILEDMHHDYHGLNYNILRNNCCHFCDDLAQRLGCDPVPGWVFNFAAAYRIVKDRVTTPRTAVKRIVDAPREMLGKVVG